MKRRQVVGKHAPHNAGCGRVNIPGYDNINNHEKLVKRKQHPYYAKDIEYHVRTGSLPRSG